MGRLIQFVILLSISLSGALVAYEHDLYSSKSEKSNLVGMVDVSGSMLANTYNHEIDYVDFAYRLTNESGYCITGEVAKYDPKLYRGFTTNKKDPDGDHNGRPTGWKSTVLLKDPSDNTRMPMGLISDNKWRVFTDSKNFTIIDNSTEYPPQTSTYSGIEGGEKTVHFIGGDAGWDLAANKRAMKRESQNTWLTRQYFSNGNLTFKFLTNNGTKYWGTWWGSTTDDEYRVAFKKPGEWSDPRVNVYYWKSDLEHATWPGETMKSVGNDWYIYKVGKNVNSWNNLIFNNKEGGDPQTLDLKINKDSIFYDFVEEKGKYSGKRDDERFLLTDINGSEYDIYVPKKGCFELKFFADTKMYSIQEVIELENDKQACENGSYAPTSPGKMEVTWDSSSKTVEVKKLKQHLIRNVYQMANRGKVHLVRMREGGSDEEIDKRDEEYKILYGMNSIANDYGTVLNGSLLNWDIDYPKGKMASLTEAKIEEIPESINVALAGYNGTAKSYEKDKLINILKTKGYAWSGYCADSSVDCLEPIYFALENWRRMQSMRGIRISAPMLNGTAVAPPHNSSITDTIHKFDTIEKGVDARKYCLYLKNGTAENLQIKTTELKDDWSGDKPTTNGEINIVLFRGNSGTDFKLDKYKWSTDGTNWNVVPEKGELSPAWTYGGGDGATPQNNNYQLDDDDSGDYYYLKEAFEYPTREKNNRVLWRIKRKGAKYYQFHFSSLNLEGGDRVYVYNDDQAERMNNRVELVKSSMSELLNNPEIHEKVNFSFGQFYQCKNSSTEPEKCEKGNPDSIRIISKFSDTPENHINAINSMRTGHMTPTSFAIDKAFDYINKDSGIGSCWECNKTALMLLTDGYPRLHSGSKEEEVNSVKKAEKYFISTTAFNSSIHQTDGTDEKDKTAPKYSKMRTYPITMSQQVVPMTNVANVSQCDSSDPEDSECKPITPVINSPEELKNAINKIISEVPPPNPIVDNVGVPSVQYNLDSEMFENYIHVGVLLPSRSGHWIGNLKKHCILTMIDRTGEFANEEQNCLFQFNLSLGDKDNKFGAVRADEVLEKFTGDMGFDAAQKVDGSGLHGVDITSRADRIYSNSGKETISGKLRNWFNGYYYSDDLTAKRTNFLGDSFHASAATIKDGNTDIILMGTNAGTIEVIKDTFTDDYNHQSTSVEEVKVIVPTEKMWKKYKPDTETLPGFVTTGEKKGNGISDKLKLYGVDLTPVVLDDYTLFGFRRGGRGYVAITNDSLKDSFSPVITRYDDIINLEGVNIFNQSWSIPRKYKFKSDDKSYVLMGAGYSPHFDDNDQVASNYKNDPASAQGYNAKGVLMYEHGLTPPATNDSGAFSNLHTNFDYPVVGSIAGVRMDDLTKDKKDLDAPVHKGIDALYAVDIMGNLYYAAANSAPIFSKLAYIGGNDALENSKARKSLSHPTAYVRGTGIMSVDKKTFKRREAWIYYGTGDRTRAREKLDIAPNYIIGFKQSFLEDVNGSYMPTSTSSAINAIDNDKLQNMTGVTGKGCILQSDPDPKKAKYKLHPDCDEHADKQGWFFKLPGKRQLIGSPVVFEESLWVTIYNPEPENDSSTNAKTSIYFFHNSTNAFSPPDVTITYKNSLESTLNMVATTKPDGSAADTSSGTWYEITGIDIEESDFPIKITFNKNTTSVESKKSFSYSSSGNTIAFVTDRDNATSGEFYEDLTPFKKTCQSKRISGVSEIWQFNLFSGAPKAFYDTPDLYQIDTSMAKNSLNASDYLMTFIKHISSPLYADPHKTVAPETSPPGGMPADSRAQATDVAPGGVPSPPSVYLHGVPVISYDDAGNPKTYADGTVKKTAVYVKFLLIGNSPADNTDPNGKRPKTNSLEQVTPLRGGRLGRNSKITVNPSDTLTGIQGNCSNGIVQKDLGEDCDPPERAINQDGTFGRWICPLDCKLIEKIIWWKIY